MEFDLTRDNFKKLTSSNCCYCGAAPKNIACNFSNNGTFIYNGLDQVDNSKGYTLDSVALCCKTCNYAKNKMNVGDFLDWVRKAHNYSLIGETK